MVVDWVTAKPFMPRRLPLPSYNQNSYNGRGSVYDGHSQYTNNNNCHHRGKVSILHTVTYLAKLLDIF